MSRGSRLSRGGREVLSRLLRYGQRVFGLNEATARVRDTRPGARIPAVRFVRSLLTMEWTRLGSFHALEQARPGGPWQGWLGGALPSADALGDAAAALELDDLREELFRQYTVLKRNKAIRPLPRGPAPRTAGARWREGRQRGPSAAASTVAPSTPPLPSA